MNKDKLTSLCHKISKETGLTFNSIMTQYFLETILNRLALSKYNGNLIFKGGFILSNLLGLETRSTVDIDFLITKMEMSEKQIKILIEEALINNFDGNIIYNIQKIKEIKEQDQYGGFRVIIICKLENIRQVIPLDIATGDVVIPYPKTYLYNSSFGLKNIEIKAYPIETIISEKLQIIYSKGFLNSRSKDYYDLHIIYNLKRNEINFDILKEACKKTFNYRNTDLDYNDIHKFLENIREDKYFRKRWEVYERRNSYVRGTKFEMVINSILNLLRLIED